MQRVLIAIMLGLLQAKSVIAQPNFGGYVPVGALDVALMREAERQNSPGFLVIPGVCEATPFFHCRYARSDKIFLAAMGDSERSRSRAIRVACDTKEVDILCDETIRFVMAVLDPDISPAKQELIIKDLYATFASKSGVARRGGMTAAYTLKRRDDGVIEFEAAPRS